jgi:hypothetical protein
LPAYSARQPATGGQPIDRLSLIGFLLTIDAQPSAWYYLPEITMNFRIKPIPPKRLQHQKGFSDDAFEQLCPDEEACRRAWFAWRWPEGFKCSRCATTEYSQIRDRQLLQCRRCRYQVSPIAGTVLQGTNLPMRGWFRAMHPLAQGKKGLSSIELGRRLGISTNATWRMQHKLMQAMLERNRRYNLGAAGLRIEIDDVYIGGEGAGRSRRGQTPFIIAVETTADGRPLHTRLQAVRGFQTVETKRLCMNVEAGAIIVSDGGQWFRCIAEQLGIVHERHVTGSDRAAARHPAFRWGYLGAFVWRFNRRFVLKTIYQRLAIAAAITTPMPYRLLKLAEARW